MAQNRFLTAVENLWESVQEAKGVVVTLVVKRIFHRAFDMPTNLLVTDSTHPMQLYAHGSLDNIRGRMREAFRLSSDNDDVHDVIDEITQTEDSSLFILMTTVISKYRQWRSVMEASDSDSE